MFLTEYYEIFRFFIYTVIPVQRSSICSAERFSTSFVFVLSIE